MVATKTPGTSDDIDDIDEIDDINNDDINEPLEADDDDDDHDDDKARTLSSRTDRLMDTFRDYISSMEVVGGVDDEVGTGGAREE
jgi:hypothetical protein